MRLLNNPKSVPKSNEAVDSQLRLGLEMLLGATPTTRDGVVPNE